MSPGPERSPGDPRSTSASAPPGTSRPRRGAEARLESGEYLGTPIIIKTRLAKGYRHAKLDHGLRHQRLRREVRMLQRMAAAGIPAPAVLAVDPANLALSLEVIDGPDLISLQPPILATALPVLAVTIARLHDARLAHGDLTLGNVLWTNDRCVLIDPSMGESEAEDEALAVDLHALSQSLRSIGRGDLAAGFVSAYQEAGGGEMVLKRYRALETRGRYT